MFDQQANRNDSTWSSNGDLSAMIDAEVNEGGPSLGNGEPSAPSTSLAKAASPALEQKPPCPAPDEVVRLPLRQDLHGSKSMILLESPHHGNTAKVAKAIAGVLGADVAAPEAVPFTSLAEGQLLGLASGVYYGRMHEALFTWLRGLPDAPVPTMPAFIVSTSGLPFLAKLWHAPLRRLLARKGFRVVGEFACRGFDTWGPLWLTGGLNRAHPDARDLARAEKFAAGLASARSRFS